jgi:hypothetical protein
VTAYSVKAVVDTRYTYVTLSAYAALLAAWGYTRLYVFPFCVIPHAVVPGEVTVAWVTGYVMIWTLQALHVYWYALFLIMGYRFAVSGKTVDIQQSQTRRTCTARTSGQPSACVAPDEMALAQCLLLPCLAVRDR